MSQPLSNESAGASLNAPIRPRCSRHADREAIAENDTRRQAMCRECYEEWLIGTPPAGEPYAQMVQMRTSAIKALDTFPGQTISDRALAAANREVTDEMVDVLVRASGWLVDQPLLLESARAHWRQALEAAFSTKEER